MPLPPSRTHQPPTSPLHTLSLAVPFSSLSVFCRARAVDPAALLQLSWALVLRAFVGIDRVVFGVQFPGRDDDVLHGIRRAVGSFAGLLPCPVDVDPCRTLEACLQAVGDAHTAARKHQNLTMAEMQHALRLRDRRLFNTCFSFEEALAVAADEEEDVPPLPCDVAPRLVTASRRSDCDVSLTTTVVGDHVHANLSAAYLSPVQATSVLSSFDAAVTAIASSPAALVSSVDLFSQQPVSPEKATRVFSRLHDAILAHATTHPDSPAVCSWDGDFTYAQLSSLVSRLRTHLTHLGVGAHSVVPVVLDKNRFAPVMLLAVLQAGAAFVALDGQDPLTAQSTVRYLQPHLVLAADSGWKHLAGLVSGLVIVNDAFFSTLPPAADDAFECDATPDHAACVFVTPKRTNGGASRSIFFTHASLCSAFSAQAPALLLDAEARVLQLSAFNVDVSLVEVLGSLYNGACVCVPSAADRLGDIEGAINSMKATWTYMTGVLARRIDPARVPSLKTLVFRTRKLDADTYTPWLAGRRAVLLAYGAADICPLSISVTRVSARRDLSIISPPLSGRFWILHPDDPRRLVPTGAIGELAIDSPLVTPHRFSPDIPILAPPPPDKPRYLKTGHRVRSLGSGAVQFLSSIRDDVLVNGSPVDVADVEQKMRRVLGPGVDVVVDKVTTRDSLRILAAFVQLGDGLFHGQDEDLHGLSLRVRERAFMARKLFETALDEESIRLPEQSVPAVFVPLRTLPLSTSLKVNRRKLLRLAAETTYADLLSASSVPNPHEIQRAVLGQKPLPLTRPEEVMRAIWARVLDVSPGDIRGTSSFFSAGGNTFLAAELVVSCRKAGLRVSLRDVFDEASLTDMCQTSSLQRTLSASSSRKPSVTGFDDDFIRHVIAPQLDCQPHHVLDVTEATAEQVRNLELATYKTRADMACLVLRFNGRVSPEKLEGACEALCRMHPVLRTAFVVHEHKAYQVYCGAGQPLFQRESCPASRLDVVVREQVAKDQNIPFRPGVACTGFTYLDTGDQGTLVIRLSKAQVDDASAPLLVQHLVALYEEEKRRLPPSSSFFDYARAAKAANAVDGLEYWTAQLDGATMTNITPQPSPRRPSPSSLIQTLSQTIRIGSCLPDHAISPDTLVKSAWATVLANLSGIDDVLFGEVVPGHNVPLPRGTNLASMAGPLTNVIPVRVRFPPQHGTPLDLMNYLERQRRSNCRFESVGIHELAASRCAKWPGWTRFGTVVQHRTISPLDGSATYNMGGTTFTYQSVDPEVRHVPDMLVCTTMEGSERITVDLSFPEDRVGRDLAKECLRLLAAALETLTHRDTLTQPMLQSAEEIRRSERCIPLPVRPGSLDPKVPLDDLLRPEPRRQLEDAIAESWSAAVKPPTQGLPDTSPTNQTPFYARGGSPLTAHLLATALSHRIPKLPLKGVETVSFSAEDILEHPTALSQLELVARHLRESGALDLPLPRPKTALRSTPSATSMNTNTRRPRTSSGPSPLPIGATASASCAARNPKPACAP